ncbi:MAG: hypothetical protein AAFX94_15850 [Myxococcota bacterium]
MGEDRIDVREATPLKDPGIFAARFVPEQAGVYALWILGPHEHGWTVHVGSKTPSSADAPARPEAFPEARSGHLELGRDACRRLCRSDIPGAEKKKELPIWLRSSFGIRHQDADLLKATLTAPPASRVERADLLYYLRSLHRSVQEIAPAARKLLAKRFSINEYGRDRLSEAKVTPGTLSSGWVFVLFRGKGNTLEHVDYADRIARDSLEDQDKLGYLVLFDRAKDPELREIAFYLGPEPNYPIVSVTGRSLTGALTPKLSDQLSSVAGLGRFNEPESLKGAPRPLRKTLTPLYLIAAELATMYVGEEREFNAFDDEFEN